MSDKELEEFGEFLANMSVEDFEKEMKIAEKEIFTNEFCKELNKECE